MLYVSCWLTTLAVLPQTSPDLQKIAQGTNTAYLRFPFYVLQPLKDKRYPGVSLFSAPPFTQRY